MFYFPSLILMIEQTLVVIELNKENIYFLPKKQNVDNNLKIDGVILLLLRANLAIQILVI